MLRISELLGTAGARPEILWLESSGSGTNPVSVSKRITRFVSRLSFLRQLIRQVREFDAIYLTFTSDLSFSTTVAPVILLAKFFGKKMLLDYRYFTDFARIYEGGPLQSCLLKACDRVLVLSEFQHHRLERHNLRGGYLPEFLRCEGAEARVVSTVQPRIVVAGPLEKVNNVTCVLRAYRLAKQKYPRTELIVAGHGSQRQALINFVNRERLPGVTFRSIDSIYDLRDLYAQADVYINCSHLDYLPTTMVEAAAHGLPMISTPSVSVLEYFAEGESVLLARYNDHVSLSDTIISLVENPALAEKLSSQGAKRAEAFRWEKVRKHWLTFFSSMGPHRA